jgi:hypothetical protein
MFQERDIVTPHAHDVLCGRGNFANTHQGNRNWRRLVTVNKDLYAALPKFQKQLLSQSIVSAVTSQDPPGRFLQRDSVSQLWYNVGESKAIEKTSQALREGGIQVRSEQLLEKGITPESLNLASPQFDAKQWTTTTTTTMSGEQQTLSAINIYMPSVKDARKIVKKVEEPANVQATSMYNSQQQTYGSLRHEMTYGHQQEEHSNPPYSQQQQQPVSYDHPYGHQAPPIMHPNPDNHHQYSPPPPPPPPQGPPPSSSVPYPSQQQQQQHPPTHPLLPRGMGPFYASVTPNTNRPPCGGGASHVPSLPSPHVSEERAAEIIAAAVAAAADSTGNNTIPATDGNRAHANLPYCCCYHPPPAAGSNNTTQEEVESVSTQEDSKVSRDGDFKRKARRSSKAPKESVVTFSEDFARNENDATTTTRPEDPFAKPSASLGSISAMSVSGIMPTIQTSFGSMSLEESSLKKATMPNKIDTSVPTLTLHERSKGDLLDDSDRDDEDDDNEEEEEMSNPTAPDWEKMQKVFGITENDFRPSVGNVTGMDLMRDISEMSREISGMSMEDFSLDRSPSSSTYMMRDTTMGSIGGGKKDDYEMSEEEKLEKMLLGRGRSLVNEYYRTSEQK